MTIVGALLGLVPGLSLGLALVGALAPFVAVGAVVPIALPISVPSISLTLLGFLVVHLIVTTLLYLVAALGTGAVVLGAPTPTNALEELARGAMIGVNTGINFATLGSLPLLSLLAAPTAVVNVVACIPAVSNHRFYQVVLAYFTLFMPAAVPVNLFGFACVVINVFAWLVGLAPFDWFIDWTHANYVTHGGITHGPIVTAWNQGNFSIAPPQMSRTDPWFQAPGAFAVDVTTANGAMFHEGVHTLTIGAFGWAFHLVGFIDTNIRRALGNPGFESYAELCAEGGLRRAGFPWVEIWTPTLQPTSPVNDPPIGNCRITGGGVVDMGEAALVGIRETAVVRGTALVATTTSPPLGFVADVHGTYPEPLGFLWELGPPGGALAVAQVGGATFGFTPTVGGDTTLILTVTDGGDGIERFHSVHALAAVIAQPVAGTVGAPVTLDGSASTAGLEDPVASTAFPLTFLWEVTVQPAGPAPTLANATAAIATLTPAAAGPHEIRLTVSATFPTAGPGPSTQTLTDTVTAQVPVQ